MNDIRPLVYIVVGVVVLFCGIFFVTNRLTFPAEVAQIEQLRQDAAQVSAATAEDVIGQVTATNQNIVSYQAYNSMWWSGWLVPDGWDQIRRIPVPRDPACVPAPQ